MKHALTSSLASCLLASGALAHLGEADKLLPSDGAPGDQFGYAVAIDGPTAVVSAPFHQVGPSLGAVYVYLRSTPLNWPEVAKVTPTGAGASDLFGATMAIDGPYLVVSAPKANSEEGVVYVFNGFGATWSQTQVLTASDAGPGHGFGLALDIRGDTLVVGAPGNEAAYVFRLVSGSWVEEQKLSRAGQAGDLFGTSVSLYVDEVVVGAPGDDTDGTDAGSVFLFDRSGTLWTEGYRFGSGTPGNGDAFGQSACIGANFVGVGAPLDDDSGADSGAAHYFRRDGLGGWISEGTLTSIAAPTGAGDHLGETMVNDTNLFVIGQPEGDLQGFGSGGVQSFIERVGVFYGDVMFPSDTTVRDHLGASVGISGCWIVAGAPKDDDNGENSGGAYVFQGAPLTTLYCVPGISAKGCAATLSTTGTASASQTVGFHVIADGVEGGISGTYFYGVNGGQQAPWGNGTSFQCVVPPAIRMGGLISTGSGTCAGKFSQDFNATWCSTCPLPTKNPGAGAEIYVQLWYRDPLNTSNQSTALSNAAQIAVCP